MSRRSFRRDAVFLLLLVLGAGFLFGFRLGAAGLLVPDEAFYAETAKEMLERGVLSTPVLFGEPQFEKPIFFYWVIAAAFKLFGVNEFAARIGPCVAGILTVIVTYFWARTLFRRSGIAFVSAAILAASAQFIAQSRLVLTDIFLCLFVTSALFSFSLGYSRPKARPFAWTLLFFFCGLGFLTKGPLGVLVPFAGILFFLIAGGERHLVREIPWKRGALVFLLTGMPWYALMAARHGPGFLKHFFLHENVRRFFVAEHPSMDRFYFYPAMLLLGWFPWSAFLPAALFHHFREASKSRTRARKVSLFLTLSFALPFSFFMLAESKLPSYPFPVFPVVALLLGGWFYRGWRALRLGSKPSALLGGLLIGLWGVFPVVLLAVLWLYGRRVGVDITGSLAAAALFFVPLSWSSLACYFKGRYRTCFALVLLGVLVFAGVGFGRLLPEAAAALSVKGAAERYRRSVSAEGSGFLLASKMIVRGVSYYTGGRKVGVLIEDPRRVFYTRHPVPIFSTPADLSSIPGESFPVYCFLRPKEANLLRRFGGQGFSLEVIHESGRRVLARLDRAGK